VEVHLLSCSFSRWKNAWRIAVCDIQVKDVDYIVLESIEEHGSSYLFPLTSCFPMEITSEKQAAKLSMKQKHNCTCWIDENKCTITSIFCNCTINELRPRNRQIRFNTRTKSWIQSYSLWLLWFYNKNPHTTLIRTGMFDKYKLPSNEAGSHT